ncbi:hypothetical protein M8J77_014205 [Diaphorina citri]|nr:hypothetical protein M8J77_014205 [Diaphorina citri]
MPVRRGHVAPRTTIIETIIRKFDTHIDKNRINDVINTTATCPDYLLCSKHQRHIEHSRQGLKIKYLYSFTLQHDSK